MNPPDEVVIEPERPGDAVAIRDVVARAFAEQAQVADLIELIRASPQYVPDLALVARVGRVVPPGRIAATAVVGRSVPTLAGFVILSHAEVVAGDVRHDVLTLSPLAVAPEFQRRGIGSALVRAGIAAAEATGAGLVTLEGSPAYYGRLGFTYAPDSGVTIDLPDWAPRQAAQVYRLRACDRAVRGRLVYPPAFDIVQG